MAFTGRTPPPFHPNSEDNLRCGQACLRMAFEALTGDRLDSDAVDTVTNFNKGYGVFIPSVLNFLSSRNVPASIIQQSMVDGLPTPTAQQANIPSINDIFQHIQQRRLLMTSLNYFGLINEEDQPVTALNYFGLYGENEKYSGHYVLIYDIDSKNQLVRLHNPGLPPLPAQEITFDNLLRAMNSPSPKAANLIAIGS